MSTAVMAAIWEQHRPTMIARVEVLERAAACASAGALEEPLEAEARSAAHQLAGSVGTFGYVRASELAREIEGLLKEGAAAGAQPLVANLREALETAPFVADVSAPPPPPQAPPPPPGAVPPPPPDVLPPPAEALPLILFVTPENDTAQRVRAESARRGLRSDVVAAAPEAKEAILRLQPSAVVAFGAGVLAGLGRIEAPVLVVADDDSLAGRRLAVERGAELFLESAATVSEVVDAATIVLERAARPATRVVTVGCELDGAVRLDDSEGLLDELVQTDPDILVLAGDGAEDLCSVLRADRRWMALPVIVLGTGEVPGADDVVADAADLPDRVRARARRGRIHAALAEYDPVTGAANRRSAGVRMGRLLRLAERHELQMCVVSVEVQDAATAVRLGTYLRRDLRGEDVVGRQGETTYMLGMLGVGRSMAVDRIDGVRTASEIPFSAGVAQYPADGTDLEALFEGAGRALRAALGPGAEQVVGAGRGAGTTKLVDVAIVEDEDAAAALIKVSLTERGRSCWRFSNGSSAIDLLGGDEPQVRAGVILLDLNLPAVGGMELLTMLARSGVLRTSRVIVVSANEDPEVQAQARALGAEDYLIKPVDLTALAARVDEALGRRR